MNPDTGLILGKTERILREQIKRMMVRYRGGYYIIVVSSRVAPQEIL